MACRWEARKDVGQLVSFAHNIMRQVCVALGCNGNWGLISISCTQVLSSRRQDVGVLRDTLCACASVTNMPTCPPVRVPTLLHQAVAYFPPHQAELTHAMARWVSASMWVVKAMVRQGAPLRDELKGEEG